MRHSLTTILVSPLTRAFQAWTTLGRLQGQHSGEIFTLKSLSKSVSSAVLYSGRRTRRLQVGGLTGARRPARIAHARARAARAAVHATAATSGTTVATATVLATAIGSGTATTRTKTATATVIVTASRRGRAAVGVPRRTGSGASVIVNVRVHLRRLLIPTAMLQRLDPMRMWMRMRASRPPLVLLLTLLPSRTKT